jgi:hypothetical protein
MSNLSLRGAFDEAIYFIIQLRDCFAQNARNDSQSFEFSDVFLFCVT